MCVCSYISQKVLDLDGIDMDFIHVEISLNLGRIFRNGSFDNGYEWRSIPNGNKRDSKRFTKEKE